jgi:1,2-beta-oligoglucan phosphorylase
MRAGIRSTGATGLRLASPSGMTAWFTEGSVLRRLEVGERSILLYPADELESGPANLFLRRRSAAGRDVCALLGPGSPGHVRLTDAGPIVTGSWQGLDYRVSFRLGACVTAWYWHVAVTNRDVDAAEVDVVYAQDVALASYATVRTNEYYVSQYLDLTPVVTDEAGTALAVRQNMPGTESPWILIGSMRDGTGWGTDALQVTGFGRDGIVAGLARDLPNARLQHEHTLALVQDRAVVLGQHQTLRTGFFGIYTPDHPAATSAADRAAATEALGQPEARTPFAGHHSASRSGQDSTTPMTVYSLFSPAQTLSCLPLAEETLSALAGPGCHHADRSAKALLSFFTDEGSHVVTAAKEACVLRPHGHIMRTGSSLVPDKASLTSTSWMTGTFHSQVTQGHVARNRVLSARRSYLALKQAAGIRVFVRSADEDDWVLLDEPSAWAVDPDRCRWWYQHEAGLLEVVSTAPADVHELGLTIRQLAGAPPHLLVCAHVALGEDDGQEPEPPELRVTDAEVTVSPAAGSVARDRFPHGSFRLAWDPGTAAVIGRDEILFADGLSRGLPWVTIATSAVAELNLTLTADLVPKREIVAQEPGEFLRPGFWPGLTAAIRLECPQGSPAFDEVNRLDTITRWFLHDALVHYLSPRGLEQYTGGAWGTRDVCQGPVGLLVALGQLPPLRDLLLRVMRAQKSDGDWPQAFEFFCDAPMPGQSESHGDVVFWPLLALGQYITISGDGGLLAELVRVRREDGVSAAEPVIEHVRRALDHIGRGTIQGSPLPAYGNGDWNDSLQPADPRMAAHLCSSWTAVLQVHALRTLADALNRTASGTLNADLQTLAAACAADADQLADQTARTLQEVLVADGELAGYVLLSAGGVIEHLVHPSDERTGLHHGILPMIHAISADLLTPDQARTHLAVIAEHLLGPDGARLFDRPAAYRGGPMKVFQRAEAATFFGREIGLMYTAAHLRYAEALARYGDGEGLLEALALVNPISLKERVPSAGRRQSNCYYSSSDAAFEDRYKAEAHYDRIPRGEVTLEGGWRVYSSGPGIFLRLVVESMLGIRRRGDRVEIDPVLPRSLNGLKARIPFDRATIDVTYRVGARGAGPTAVVLNGVRMPMVPLANPYRAPGVSVPLWQVREILAGAPGRLDVEVP